MNTEIKTRKNRLLSHAGHEEKWCHSLMKSISMEVEASFFLGMKRTEKSTRTHWSTTSTLVRKNRSSSMCQNQEQKQNQHKTRCGLCFFPLILNLLCFCHGGWKSLVKYGNKYSEFLPREKAICLYLEIWQRTSFYICELEQITPFNYFSTL